MSERFQRFFELLKVHEGGFSDHPADPGGRTMKGVTQRTYDAYRRRMGQTERDVREITDTEVERIYRGQYWAAVKADDLPEGVAYCVADAAVNSGPGQAATWLQRVIGAKVDGIVGNETVTLAHSMDPADLINAYCDRRLAFMKRLRHWSKFKNGWTRRVSEVREQSLEWARHGAVTRPTARPPEEAKAEGEKSIGATIKDTVTNPRAISAGGGVLSSVLTAATGDGPLPWAISGVLILATVAAIYLLVKQIKE